MLRLIHADTFCLIGSLLSSILVCTCTTFPQRRTLIPAHSASEAVFPNPTGPSPADSAKSWTKAGKNSTPAVQPCPGLPQRKRHAPLWPLGHRMVRPSAVTPGGSSLSTGNADDLEGTPRWGGGITTAATARARQTPKELLAKPGPNTLYPTVLFQPYLRKLLSSLLYK